MRTRSIIFSLTAALALIALAVGEFGWTHRFAQPDTKQPKTAVDQAAALPDDVDLVLVIENVSDLRDTPIGRSVRAFLADSGVLAELSKSWKGLADELGWSEDVALDRLLGRRVMLVSKSLEGSVERRWAVMSDVSVETERRLKQRLKAAPRAIDAGHQILSVENGQYELVSHLHTIRSDGAVNAGDAVTIVLGPAGRGELFDQIVASLARGHAGVATPLGAHDVIEKARRAGPAELLLIAQTAPKSSAIDIDTPERARRWRDFVVLTGRRAEIENKAAAASGVPGSTWQSRVIVRDSSRRNELRHIPRTSDSGFRAIERGSLLAIVQGAPLDEILGAESPITTLLGGLPLPEAARALAAGRQALRLRTVEPRGRLACTLAMETTDARKLAATLDGAVARGIQSMEQRFGALTPPPRDFAGIAPTAPRVVEFTVPKSSPMSSLLTEPVMVSWCFPASKEQDENGVLIPSEQPAIRPVAADSRTDVCPNVAHCPGWWTLNVLQSRPEDQPGPADVLREDADALAACRGKGEVERWVMLAAARPAEIESMLPAILPDIRSIRSIMRRLDRFHARLSITEQGDIQGDLTMTLSPTAK